MRSQDISTMIAMMWASGHDFQGDPLGFQVKEPKPFTGADVARLAEAEAKRERKNAKRRKG